MRIRLLPLIILFLTGVLQISGQEKAALNSKSVLTGVDHFYVFSEKTNAENLFKVFRDGFNLPQVWAFRDYGGYQSGSVSLGNVVLEFATFDDPANKAPKTEFQGMAFEPVADANATTAIMASRGIPYGPLETQNPGWTIIPFSNLPPENAFMMLCDYKDRKFMADLYSKKAAALDASNGGNLGVTSLKEIVIGVKDLKDAIAKWQLAMGRQIGSSNRFKFTIGPDIRLVQTGAPGIKEIHIRIKSKAAAKRFLSDRQMLGNDRDGGMTVKPSAIGGLSVVLVKS
jgi:hypothetical protein